MMPPVRVVEEVPVATDYRRFASLGMLLVDSGGTVCCDRTFSDVFSVPSDLPLSESAVARIFPSGFRPADCISTAPASVRSCRLSTQGGRTLAVTLHSERLGPSSWTIAIRAEEAEEETKEAAPHLVALQLLEDQLASRHHIARYLHDTVSQSMVAVAFHLSRLQRHAVLASHSDLSRAIELSENSAREVRVLNHLLGLPVSTAEDSRRLSCAAAALQCYFDSLERDAGLPVSFEIAGPLPEAALLDRFARSLICAATQRWAEVAAGNPVPTRVVLSSRPPGLELRFLSVAPHNPAILALLSSSLLRECLRVTGGSLDTVPSYDGGSARLVIGTARRPA
jgi:hypothetical protein